MHVTLVPHIAAAGELKTKPTQHSVKALLSIGIQPDILVCRTEKPLYDEIKKKIGLFCNVPAEAVISAKDAETIYEVPLLFHEQGFDNLVCRRLELPQGEPELETMARWDWKYIATHVQRNTRRTVVARP